MLSAKLTPKNYAIRWLKLRMITVTAQIVRLISANEWGVTTEFWHFDFSVYLKHGTYGIMGSYGTFMHYVRSFIQKKCILGSYGQEFGSEMRFRDSWDSWVRVLPVCPFWIWPRIRAALGQGCSEHISDPKEPNGKFMNSTPPFGTSAENPGAHDLSRYHKLMRNM